MKALRTMTMKKCTGTGHYGHKANFFDGKGFSLATVREDYGDFEMLVDWKIQPEGDSGIYLRGTPQVQIWDAKQRQIGSGGLYNNEKNPSKPTENRRQARGAKGIVRIKMVGDKVTVFLNGNSVDNGRWRNYGDRTPAISRPARSSCSATATPSISATSTCVNCRAGNKRFGG
jgi:hypothetical protein